MALSSMVLISSHVSSWTNPTWLASMKQGSAIMITNPKAASTVRLITAGALIAMAAYWAGSRWGEHEIQRVENVFAQGGNTRPVSRPANLTEDEALTVKIYSQASPAVANINTQAVEYDF